MNSSKVTPLGTKVNNLVHPKYDVLQRLKFVSGLQFFIGINRLYLFVNHRYKIRISYVYSLTVVVLILFVIIRCEMKTATYLVFRNTSIIEYTLLSLNSILLYNKTLKKFFDRMEAFDDLLNIKNNAVLTFHSGYLLVFCFIFVMYIVLEMIYLQRIETVVGVELVPYTYLTIYFTFLAHDTEIFFFCVLLIMVMRRLKVIKGHVAKMFLGKQKKESKKLAALSYNANLDVSDLHRAYDTLHTCSEKLNSAMNFPVSLL
ncbi:unnamed protein product [Leptosia nina]|uniref:Gustatory receptor n=1 Tax=Leptosia nina TaxID=320188 RepID=A0AAV1J3E8_9NEOP